MITSKANPKIKQARALQTRKEREATGLFLVEGITHVGAAIDAGAAIDSIFYAPDLLKSQFGQNLVQRAEQAGINCLPTDADIFASISDKDNPSGLLAIVRKPISNLQSLREASNSLSLFVALVSPQDPGNIGTILRSIDAANASGLILLDGGTDPYAPNAVRASMGALFYKPVVSSSFDDFAAWAKHNAYTIIGTSAKGSVDYRAADYARPAILLMGNEQKGLSAEQLAACSMAVKMPMLGKVSSLNLAVAAGVMLYAMLPPEN
jgi:RNA methyltransferase, TrmH family